MVRKSILDLLRVMSDILPANTGINVLGAAGRAWLSAHITTVNATDVAASSGMTINSVAVPSISSTNTLSNKTLDTTNTIQVEAWRVVGDVGQPDYANSWVSYDGGSTYDVAKFRKDIMGRVHLRGIVKSGSIDVTGAAEIFTLPSGYRPAKRLLLVISSNGSHGRIQINTDGKIVATHGSNVYVALDGISFFTD